MEEYKKINETLAAIAEAENKIKREQLRELQNISIEEEKNITHADQSKVPAAMRTSILFGDVRFDEDIKKTRELEKKKWLQELEEQKREKLLLDSKKNLSINVNNNNNSHRQFDSITNPYDLSPRELKHLKVTSMANQRANILNNLNVCICLFKQILKLKKNYMLK